MNKLKKKNLHVIFFALLLIIIIITVAKIMIWNLGVDSDYDPNNLLEGFDTEVNDTLIYGSADKEDDGVYNVLLIGNGTLCDTNGLNQIPELVKQKTNANIYTVAFPDVLASSFTESSAAPAAGLDAFSFYRICYALADHNFTHQDNFIDEVTETYGSFYRESLDTMKSIDMSTIDTVVIYYDGSDYFARLGLFNPGDENDIKTFKGTFTFGINRLKQAYPDINYVLASVHYSPYIDEEGNVQDSNSVNLGNGEFYGYFQMQVEVAAGLSISFIDNYYGSIHNENYSEYLTDNIHLNAAGQELLAGRLAEFINQFR